MANFLTKKNRIKKILSESHFFLGNRRSFTWKHLEGIFSKIYARTVPIIDGKKLGFSKKNSTRAHEKVQKTVRNNGTHLTTQNLTFYWSQTQKPTAKSNATSNLRNHAPRNFPNTPNTLPRKTPTTTEKKTENPERNPTKSQLFQ